MTKLRTARETAAQIANERRDAEATASQKWQAEDYVPVTQPEQATDPWAAE